MTDFNMRNEDDFNTTIASLANRTLRTFKVAHTLLVEGKYRCLDLDLTADSVQELGDQIVAKVAGMGREEILPAITTGPWRAFVHGDFVPPFTTIQAPGAGRKNVVIIAVRTPHVG